MANAIDFYRGKNEKHWFGHNFGISNPKLNIQNEIKHKYKNYDLDTIFKNHEIFNNLDIKSLTQIPKETLLYDEIEKIWHDIDNNDDWSLFNKKIDSINIFKQANINHGLG